MRMTEAEFRQKREHYEGFCTSCEDFTRDETEPDAEEYACPDCDENTVVGAEIALENELIEIVEVPS